MEIVSFHRNSLADGIADETYNPGPHTWWNKVLDLFHPGTYCVRRCGFYHGNYNIKKKSEMQARREYDNKTGCNGIPWVAFEGSYSACREFRRQNQTYEYYAN